MVVSSVDIAFIMFSQLIMYLSASGLEDVSGLLSLVQDVKVSCFSNSCY